MTQAEFQNLLQRFQTGDCTPEEQRVVEHWFELLGEDRKLRVAPDEREAIRSELWQRIASQTIDSEVDEPPRQSEHTSSRRSRGGYWAAAALLAIAAALATFTVHSPKLPAATGQQPTIRKSGGRQWASFTNTTAQPVTLALQDGSSVAVAPASSLKYPTTFRGAHRTVFLTGAAFFKVHHDAAHPFLVYTEKTVTTVLGTSFMVEAYADQPRVLVQVKTGRVRVSQRDSSAALTDAGSIVVIPNQQAVYQINSHKLEKKLVPQPAVLVPQPFVFRDRPVAEVLQALEQAYGVDIVYDKAVLANCTVNLVLNNESLYEKLDVLCKMLGATYQESDAQILIHSPGCQAE